jgi:ribonuclease HII
VTDQVRSVQIVRPPRRRSKKPRDAHMRHERELRLAGFQRIAGLDEVGRGSLAGPVVAAAVVLPQRHRIKGLRDSKVVPRARREALYRLILDRAEAVGVGCIEVEVIDAINILQATKLAMREALCRSAPSSTAMPSRRRSPPRPSSPR